MTLRRLPLRVRLVAGFVVAMLVRADRAPAPSSTGGSSTRSTAGSTPSWPRPPRSSRRWSGRRIGVLAPAPRTPPGPAWQVLDRRRTRARLRRHRADGGRCVPARATSPTSAPACCTERHRRACCRIADKPYRVQVTAARRRPAATSSSACAATTATRRCASCCCSWPLAGLAALVVAALVGDLLARAALRPVERYRRRAAEIAGGADGLRLDVPPDRDDEVTRLGHTLNDMLAALEQLARARTPVRRRRQPRAAHAADAAHEPDPARPAPPAQRRGARGACSTSSPST